MESSERKSEESGREEQRRLRNSQRLTSDGYFNLVMPELAALRDQIQSKDQSIQILEDSVLLLEGQRNNLSHNLTHSTREIRSLKEQLEISEDATLDALKNICQERNVALKSASDFRQRFQTSQMKLKRETEKYHRLHKNWESGKYQWAEEKRRLQEIQKNAGIKLLALLEELLDTPSQQQLPMQPSNMSSNEFREGESKQGTNDLSKSSRKLKEDRATGRALQKSVQEPIPPTIDSRVRSKSRKRLSLNSYSEAASASAISLSKLSRASHENLDSRKARSDDRGRTKGAKPKSTSSSRNRRKQESTKGKRDPSRESHRSRTSRPKSRGGRSREARPSNARKQGSQASINEHMDILSAAIPSLSSKTASVRPFSMPVIDRDIYSSLIVQSPDFAPSSAGLSKKGSQNRLNSVKTPASSSLSVSKIKSYSPRQGLFIPPRNSSVGFHHKHNSSLTTERIYQQSNKSGACPQDVPPIPRKFLENIPNSNLDPYTRRSWAGPDTTVDKSFKKRVWGRIARVFGKNGRQENEI